jgi:hypothetical protein
MAKGELTEQVIEEVAENLEEVAEVTRRVSVREINFFAAGFVVGATAGIGLGFFALKKKVSREIAEYAEEEIDKIREAYRRRAKETLDGLTTDTAIEEKPPIAEVVEELGYDPAMGAKPTADELIEGAKRERAAINQNIFEEQHPEIVWDYKTELEGRTKEKPYVIHVDEFNDNELEYEQTNYTYYEADDVLTDSRDAVVDPVDLIVGAHNLRRFGHGSNDIHCVYVRNDELKLDMEINRTQASYAEEVHGFVEHSESRKSRRKRGFDDD